MQASDSSKGLPDFQPKKGVSSKQIILWGFLSASSAGDFEATETNKPREGPLSGDALLS